MGGRIYKDSTHKQNKQQQQQQRKAERDREKV